MLRQELEASLRAFQKELPGRFRWEHVFNHKKNRDEYLISVSTGGRVLGFAHFHTKHCTLDDIERLNTLIRNLADGTEEAIHIL